MDETLMAAGLSAQMLLQVHDELVFEVPEDEVERTIGLVVREMVQAPLPAIDLSVPLGVKARAADNWMRRIEDDALSCARFAIS